MLGEQPLCDNFGVSSIIKKKGIDYLFNDVRSIFHDGDIIFGNLECSIMDEGSTGKHVSTCFCAEPGVVDGLVKANFNVLSVANNHVMEHDEEFFRNTVQLLIDNNIRPVGIANNIEIVSTQGYKIAFLAYSFIEDNIPNPSYNKIYSEEPILRDIQKIRPLVDFVIISLHWGSEYVPYPSPQQIQIGRALVNAGADIILGGHPHITQSYEIYKNRPIFYSLGNFVFDHTYIPTTRESFIAKISIWGSIDSISIDVIPIVINESEYRPQIAYPPQSDSILKSVNTTKNLFENRPLSDYQASIGDYGLLHKKYKEAAKRKMKIHFIKNLHRYSLSTILDIIGSQLRR